jgi:hypothetical protein
VERGQGAAEWDGEDALFLQSPGEEETLREAQRLPPFPLSLSPFALLSSRPPHQVHCDYPALVEFLCHDINVHVPHHVSSKIPWYNLRAATDSLRSNWGK